MMAVQKVLEHAGVEATVSEEVKVDETKSLFSLTVDITNAGAIAERLSAVSAETGFCPLFPYKTDLCYWSAELAGKPEKWKKLSNTTLDAGNRIDVEKWLAQKGEPDRPVGDFSKRKMQMTQIPLSETLILVPVKESWQIPSIFTFGGGGWNECPPTAVHIALLKRWHQRYCAELVCMGVDSITCRVKNPVSTREEALALAIEQYAYCPDNVLQGTGNGTLSGAAIDLLDAKVWQFWWD
jgi:Domain of unknown function (DUF4253)